MQPILVNKNKVLCFMPTRVHTFTEQFGICETSSPSIHFICLPNENHFFKHLNLFFVIVVLFWPITYARDLSQMRRALHGPLLPVFTKRYPRFEEDQRKHRTVFWQGIGSSIKELSKNRLMNFFGSECYNQVSLDKCSDISMAQICCIYDVYLD